MGTHGHPTAHCGPTRPQPGLVPRDLTDSAASTCAKSGNYSSCTGPLLLAAQLGWIVARLPHTQVSLAALRRILHELWHSRDSPRRCLLITHVLPVVHLGIDTWWDDALGLWLPAQVCAYALEHA